MDWNKELEERLNALKSARPTDFEMQRWKKAASLESMASSFSRNRRFSHSVQFAAAGLVGFFLGWAVFGTNVLHKVKNGTVVAESRNNATVEFIYSN